VCGAALSADGDFVQVASLVDRGALVVAERSVDQVAGPVDADAARVEAVAAAPASQNVSQPARTASGARPNGRAKRRPASPVLWRTRQIQVGAQRSDVTASRRRRSDRQSQTRFWDTAK
jgi:hypothetical protein